MEKKTDNSSLAKINEAIENYIDISPPLPYLKKPRDIQATQSLRSEIGKKLINLPEFGTTIRIGRNIHMNGSLADTKSII